MRDALSQEQTLNKLRQEIQARWPQSEELSSAAITARFSARKNLIAGWRLPNVLPEHPHDLLVFLDARSPWTLPLIALPEATHAISLPHVEADGHLCITSVGLAFSLPVSVAHVEQLVNDAISLIAAGTSGANEEDFFTEAQSYWTLVEPVKSEIWLTEPPPPGHALWSAVRSFDNWAIGATRDAVNAWLRNSGRSVNANEPCAVLRVPEPMAPIDYPLTAADLLNLAKSLGAWNVVSAALTKWSAKQPLPVLLIFSHTGADVVLGGLFMPPGSHRMPGARHNGIPGFRIVPPRNARVRATALAMAGVRFPHVLAIPVYREFLLNRTAGQVPKQLRDAHVAVMGCGALGGQLAVQLAQSGVGKLTLVDNETLDWRNVGRHVLNGSSVGLAKAHELMLAIQRSFPEMKLKALGQRWDELPVEDLEELNTADLWVAATGDAASNQHLDQLIAEGGAPATVFCWLEPFAVAGHAVLHVPPGGRLRALTDDAGRVLEPVSDLHSAPALPQEPSCGAFYQPYSSLAALAAIAVTGELVLDALNGKATVSTHRVWVGSAEPFAANGLQLHPVWQERLSKFGYNRRYDLPVPPSP